jgi:superfamily I DNA/RNA helicase
MDLHPDLVARLGRLTPDQRAAATAPPGPVLCLAPAGSGKTTTLVARIAWLVAGGTPPEAIAAIAFNKRAADELVERVDAALLPLGASPRAVRVRTFHAFGREILRSAGWPVEPLIDRESLIRRVVPDADAAERRRLDAAFSTLKLEHRVTSAMVAADPAAGPRARAFVAYERALNELGGLDFDDLVARSLALLETEADLLAGWRASCRELLVDEVQDVDRSQLELALLIAAPANRVFLVGDDDQSIYGWRLADVRRVLELAGRLPGLARHDLVTNFRCPAPVVERAVRLVEGNAERFSKRIVARPNAVGRLVLAPDAGDDDERIRRVLACWSAPETAPETTGRATRAILARTNRELLPAAAVALELGIPFRAERLPLPLEDPRLDEILRTLSVDDGDVPLLIRLARLRGSASGLEALPGEAWPAAADTLEAADDPELEDRPAIVDEPGRTSDQPAGEPLSFDELLGAVLAWAAPYREARSFADAVRDRQAALTSLRRADAALTLATAHSTKGLEFDDVAVVDMDDGRFPSQRSLDDAGDPARALEEERRLAYVAWTRTRRSLTLVYDPATPSRFLLEAFTAAELGC